MARRSVIFSSFTSPITALKKWNRRCNVVAGARRHSFILDLRNNPGGTVDAALKITDLWLDEGVMLIEKDANGDEKQFEATDGQIVEDAPLVIIVDHGSASASEIVAACGMITTADACRCTDLWQRQRTIAS